MKRINGEFNPERVGKNLLPINSYLIYAIEDDIDKLREVLQKSMKVNEVSLEKFGVSSSHYGEIYKNLNQALVSLEIVRKEQLDIKSQLEKEITD